MLQSFSFWLKAVAIAQFFTAAFHIIGFFQKPVPKNDTEKQLFDLFANHKLDIMGMTPTLKGLFFSVSICFTMICIFAGALNWFLLKQHISPATMRGVVTMNLVAFTIIFGVMLRFSILPPIIFTGVIFLFLVVTWLLRNKYQV